MAQRKLGSFLLCIRTERRTIHLTSLRSCDIHGNTIISFSVTEDNDIEFVVVEPDQIRARMYLNELRAFAEFNGKNWRMVGNTVKINFGNIEEVELACQAWCG